MVVVLAELTVVVDSGWVDGAEIVTGVRESVVSAADEENELAPIKVAFTARASENERDRAVFADFLICIKFPP